MRNLLISLIALTSGSLSAASLQVINAIPQVDATAAPSVSLYVDGAPLVSQLRYAALGTLAEVPTGLHTYSIRAGDRVLVERELSLSGAAANGHMMALAGDGTTQAYRLISWQLPPLPPASTTYALQTNGQSHSQIHLAPRWDMAAYVGESPACWDAASPVSLGARSPVYETMLGFGIPAIASGYSSGSQLKTCQLNARSPTRGALSLRLPEFTPGPHVLTHFLIGNGAATTPFEWLTVDNGRILARGHGSYASGPVIAGPRFFADVSKPGSGLFLGADATSTRIFGFLIGQGSDHRSTWTLLDGPRVSANKFQLVSVGGPSSTSEELELSFQSCTDATLERRINGSTVSTSRLRRGIVPKQCSEFQQQ